MEPSTIIIYSLLFSVGCACVYAVYVGMSALIVSINYLLISIYNIILGFIVGVFKKVEHKAAARIEEDAAILDDIYTAKTRAAAERLKEDVDRLFKAEEAEKAKLALQLSSLKTKLPFYISQKLPSGELVKHDELAWKNVTNLVKEQDCRPALLYFIKIRSHLDDKEYYKIGITTLGVKERYEKSTQVEVLESVFTFKTELWKAAYLEYHFLREFRLYDGLASSLAQFRPEVRFSGYTEVVRSNSVTMISKFLGQLDSYNDLD